MTGATASRWPPPAGAGHGPSRPPWCLDTANRAFLTLLGAAVAGYAGLLVAAGSLVGLALWHLGALDDVRSVRLWIQAHDLRPMGAFLAVVAAGTALALWSLRRQLRTTRALARRVRALRVPPPRQLLLAAARSRLARRVDVVQAPEPFSFAYGLLRPRVVVSDGLVRCTSPAELEAVLEHERYHVRNLDPLKVVLARSLPCALFFFPVLRGLKRRYVASRELAADRRAAALAGRTALAGALAKVVRGPGWPELGTAAAIGGLDLLEARVTQLETGQEPPVPGVSGWAALATVAALLALTAAYAAALGELGGPVGRAVWQTFGLGPPRLGLGAGQVAGSLLRVALWAWVARAAYRALRRA